MKLGKLISNESAVAKALQSAGLDDVSKLLSASNVLNDPSELAMLLDIDETKLSALIGRAELLSIQGMGRVYVDLLFASGVQTRSQLSMCNPFELHRRIQIAAQSTNVGRIPNRATVEDWIEQARQYSYR